MSQKIEQIKENIVAGHTALGIELGSTRIKAVLIDETKAVIASGSHEWTNSYIDGVWTYSLDEVWEGIQDSYKKMAQEVETTYGETLTTIGSIGFSAMMHGYMAFDKEGELLVPFRTWRNSTTEEASKVLTQVFNFPIPQRWTIAHIYQAILNKEEHVQNIDFVTTLAGYIHWKLTGNKVLGVGEASGYFPIDSSICNYDQNMIQMFQALIQERDIKWKLTDIMPKVMVAGEKAGVLSDEGALLLDTSGNLKGKIAFCPPEGDAGTGMVATNSVAKRTGNVSAGTSVFAMVVLEKPLQGVYPEIDMVTTPSGEAVAMVHANNCTSDLDSWIRLFKEALEAFGMSVDMNTLYQTLYTKALDGDPDCGGLLAYGYLSGENITNMEEGRPLFVRTPNSSLTLGNFMRTHVLTALGALKTGLDILLKKEKVQIDKILGHGGYFKTEGVGQRFLAAAMDVPVSLMETAGEGGAWGIAVLADYMNNKGQEESLEDYLNSKVFQGEEGHRLDPDPKDVKGFDIFMERYTKGLPIERSAVEYLKD